MRWEGHCVRGVGRVNATMALEIWGCETLNSGHGFAILA